MMILVETIAYESVRGQFYETKFQCLNKKNHAQTVLTKIRLVFQFLIDETVRIFIYENLLFLFCVTFSSRHPGEACASRGEMSRGNELLLDPAGVRVPDGQATVVSRQRPVLAVRRECKLLGSCRTPDRRRCHLCLSRKQLKN